MNSFLAFILSLFSIFTPIQAPSPTPAPILHDKIILHSVPFTSQAPNYDWKDPRLQDACEEASIIMAVFWANDKTLSPNIAQSEILSSVEYQKQKYGEYRDTSLLDSAERILNGYFNYQNYKVYENNNLDQIIDQLYLGNLVVLPMNGQLLHNPNYTGIGPERHMLLVIGYDPKTQEFITNDSGTWRGKLYRYKADLIFDAIRDYSTGYHIPIKTVNKNMLVVYPQSVQAN